MKVKLGSAAIIAVGLWANAATAAPIVSNGSFESGTNGPGFGGFATIPGSSAAISDWALVGGSVDWINGYWQANSGTHSVDMNGTTPGGTLQQSISTVLGQAYQLTFYLSANPDQLDAHPDSRALVASAGSTNGIFTYKFDSPPNDHDHMNWAQYSLFFTATGSTTVLSFASAAPQNCCYGPALDDVAVVAIPEASTWAMMILGFAGVGFLSYRRKSRAVAFRLA